MDKYFGLLFIVLLFSSSAVAENFYVSGSIGVASIDDAVDTTPTTLANLGELPDSPMLSVYFQLLCGIALMLGILTRWAGIVLAINFIVAVFMVHWSQDFRGWWPAFALVGIGFQFALTGAGGISIDALVAQKRDT